MLTFFEMVGQRILEQINNLNWTQQKLADELKVSKQVLNKIIKGEKNTTILEIRQIADVLNVSIEKLLEPINEFKYSPKIEEDMFPVFMGKVDTEAGRQGLQMGFKIIDMILEYEDTLENSMNLINRSSSSLKNVKKKRDFMPNAWYE